MKEIDVEITGTCPMLHNRYAIEDFGENATKKKSKVYSIEDDVQKALYKNKDGSLYVPSEHIYRSMVKASVDFKFSGKKTFKDVISAGVLVEPENIPFDAEYVADVRAVVIGRARVPKGRPRFDEWKVNFTIKIIDDENITTQDVKEILERAGQTKGIGDYRPRFGRFTITLFQVH